MVRLFVWALAGAAFSSQPALAQSAPETADQTPDRITITASRAAQNVDQSIIAVSVTGEAEIKAVSAHHPAELLNRTPGVLLHRGNGAEHLTSIRSPILTGGAGAGSFLYLEDGVPMRAAGFSNINGLFEGLSDFAGGLEVVRGPGSALYGSNAQHGLINILTPDPSAAAPYVQVEAGSYGRYRGQGLWSDQSSLAAISATHEDGWRDEASLDRVAALLRTDGQSGNINWQATLALISLNQETAGFVRGERAYEDEALSQTNSDPEAFRDASAVRAAVRLDGPLNGDWSWTLIPYARSNQMDFAMHFLPSEALEESGHSSAGLLAAMSRTFDGGDIRIGADYERTQGTLSETQFRPTIFSYVQGDHYDYTVDAGVFALYSQARWQISGALSLQAGARYEHTAYDYDNHLASDTIGRTKRIADRSDNFDTFTPHFGALWQTGDHTHIHARLARGVRAPQTTDLYRLQINQEIDEIEPETLDSFELGYRHSFENGARIELTGFVMAKDHVFFRDADGFNVTDGKTRHHGIEFDAHFPFSETISFDVGGIWASHQYDFYRSVGRSSEVIAKGNDVDTAPRWIWNAQMNWQISEEWRASLEWAHVGAYFTDAANDHSYDGHDLLTLRARYAVTDRVEIFGSVRNLLDQRYAERADFAFGSDRYFPGEPRGVSIGVRVVG